MAPRTALPVLALALGLLLVVSATRDLGASRTLAQRRRLAQDGPAPRPPLLDHARLCRLLETAGNASLLLAADPGELSGTPEVKFFLENAEIAANGQARTANCPFVAVGSLLGQATVLGTTGIGVAAASACTSELLSCPAAAALKEAIWVGTSGWSPQRGGVLNDDDCSQPNLSTEVTRVGDICVSPLGMGFCWKASWTEQAASYPNQCYTPPVAPGPDASALFGQCMFSAPDAGSVALANELVAAAQEAAYLPRPDGVTVGEEEYWGVMQNGTGVAYDYNPEAPPAVLDYTECGEVASEMFWAAHPWDAMARGFLAELITNSGLANATARDVTVASAMEARGFLNAVYNYNAAAASPLVHTIVRAASNLDALMPVYRDPTAEDVWLAAPTVEEDITVGYAFAIGTSSTAILNLFKLRCEDAGGSAADCAFVVQ